MPAQDKRRWTDLSPEQENAFYAYLDTLPEDERPLYGVYGTKSSFWQQLGGGGKHVSIMVYSNHINVSTYTMSGGKKLSSQDRPLSDLTDVKVVEGPMQSSVELRFRDGGSVKAGDIMHKEAAPMKRLKAEGATAFERSKLTPAEISWFAWACSLGIYKGDLPAVLLESARKAG